MNLIQNEAMLQQYIKSKDVSIRYKDDMSIYCYTKQCFFGKKWDDNLIQTRGLVFYKGNLVSRPFKKIFNVDEHHTTEKDRILNLLETRPYRIYDKSNGHLAICFLKYDYCNDTEAYYATLVNTTKGVLESEFVTLDRQLVDECDVEGFIHQLRDKVHCDVTLMFEVLADYDKHTMYDYQTYLYEENTLVLLGAVINHNGQEVDRDTLEQVYDSSKATFHLVKEYKNLDALNNFNELYDKKDREGYVIHFTEDNERVKIKCDDYWIRRKLYDITTPRILSTFRKGGFKRLYEEFDEEIYTVFDTMKSAFHTFIMIKYNLINLRESVNLSTKDLFSDKSLTIEQKRYIHYNDYELDSWRNFRDDFASNDTNIKLIDNLLKV